MSQIKQMEMEGFSVFDSETLNEVPCDESPIQTWTISGDIIVLSQDTQRDEIPSQLNLECTDDMEELSPVTPGTVHLSATAKLPVPGPDTCEVDPNVVTSDSMVTHAGSQHESEGNKENYYLSINI